MADVIVIGGGIGGLSAAIAIAAGGVSVEVVEASPAVGGKAGEVVVDGVGFDTGPSVLTLPDLLRELLGGAGVDLDEVVTLRRPEPAFRYRWPDGLTLDVHQELGATELSIRSALGPRAAAEFVAFMDYSRRIWEAAAPYFVLAQAPSIPSVAALGVAGLRAAARIDPFRTMRQAIEAQIQDRHLRDLFLRFATYNGSDPSRAPATLNCIAHVEMGLGSFGVEGGMRRLPEGLARVAERLGARVRTGASVTGIDLDERGVCGVRIGEERLAARSVVVNADVAHLVDALLPSGARHGLSAPTVRSTSGWTAVMRLPRAERPAHLALFPSNYDHEFRDLFDRRRPPVEPTVYVCAQAQAHGRSGWDGADPVFVMANAPAEPGGPPTPDPTWAALREVVIARMVGAGLCGPEPEIVWERSPGGLARDFPGSRGALYGAASNSMFSAFQRPPNAVSRVPGLFLASGSAHPGGGVPLCVQSGRLAARACLAHLGARR
jgi:1-hydroxycarotenoid 3,4-desaturase